MSYVSYYAVLNLLLKNILNGLAYSYRFQMSIVFASLMSKDWKLGEIEACAQMVTLVAVMADPLKLSLEFFLLLLPVASTETLFMPTPALVP